VRHRKDTFKLNRTSAHRRALLANLVAALIVEEKIETTLPKARAAARWADRMVTLAKKNDLASRRRAVAFLGRKDAVKKLFDEIGPRFGERRGGYTRVLKMSAARRGDGGPTAVILFSEKLEASAPAPEGSKAKKEPAKKTPRKAPARKTAAKSGKKPAAGKKKSAEAPAETETPEAEQ